MSTLRSPIAIGWSVMMALVHKRSSSTIGRARLNFPESEGGAPEVRWAVFHRRWNTAGW